MKDIGIFLLFAAFSSGSRTPLQSQVGTGVIGGRDARPNEFPYIACLRVDDEKRYHHCGGSIITKSHVLTAVHCFIKYLPSELLVVAGEHSLSQVDGSEQYARILNVTYHEEFYESSNLYDIALVKLNVDFILNDFVQTIPLPQKGFQKFTGSAIISGWGKINGQNDRLEYPDILQTAEITLLPNKRCNYSALSPIICAGDINPNKGGCYGDSGGPIVQNNTLIGISAAVKPPYCASLTVFTEVSYYLDWINENM